jgi:hypothetical protein
MAGDQRRTRSRPVVAATVLSLAALTLVYAPVGSQSPEASGLPGASTIPGSSTVPGASVVPAGSAAPVDVEAIRWKQSKPGKGFGPRDGSLVILDMAVNDAGRFLMVGIDKDRSPKRKAAIFGSDDGVKWTRLKGSIPKLSGAGTIVATDDGFLIGGDIDSTTALLLHSDGATILPADTASATPPTGPLNDIVRSPSGFVASGADGTGVPTMWSSADGMSWTGTPIDGAQYVGSVAVTDSGTAVVAGPQVDANGSRRPVTWSSTDGATWTPTPLPVPPGDWGWVDMDRTPIGLVGIVHGADGYLVFRSTDGVAWTQSLETSALTGVGSAGDEAILFGPDSWSHSADGVTWTSAKAKVFDGYEIHTSAVRPDGAIIAAGYQLGPFTAIEPVDSSRTWIGKAPASEPEPSTAG